MSKVVINEMFKRFDSRPPVLAVDNLNLEIQDGEFLVLLGPSGCGKSTTLRCVAGLEQPVSGKIAFGDRTVFDSANKRNVPSERRRIGMVFQSYALWPHMTVRKNIGYPLRAQRKRQALRSGWVEETAALLECEALLDRYPSQLSGGQQQRVALARALVARPELILFDEPLSNLDARLREQVRTELHTLHRRRPFTAIFVTHDQSEALALGQRVAIMRAGSIEQVDTSQRVFDHPANEYVAEFIGMENRLVCQPGLDGWTCDGRALQGDNLPVRSRGQVALRCGPDDVTVLPIGMEARPGQTTLAGRVLEVEFGGRHLSITAAIGETIVRSRMPIGLGDTTVRGLESGAEILVGFDPTAVRAFEITDVDATKVSDPVIGASATA